MKTYLLAVVAAAALATPAQSATIVNFNLWDWPGAHNSNAASVTKSAATGQTVTITAKLWSGTQPDALTNLSQFNQTGTVRRTDGSSFLNGGLGVTGGGSTEQVDTNTVNRREAFLVEASTKLKLTSLRLNMIDANDTIRIYGIESNGALTALGFGGMIGGTGVNALQGASWAGNTGTLTFTQPLAGYKRFIFTTREGGEENINGLTGQGYRLSGINAAVPEPATWALMLGGFGLIGAATRRAGRTAVVYA